MSTNENFQSLFEQICDFPIPNYEEWEKAVVKSLKGASFSKLLTKTYEGITLKPMYQMNDLENLHFLDSKPGEYPYVRGTKRPKATMRWLVAQEMNHPIPKIVNEWLKNDLPRGLDAINLCLDESTKSGLNLHRDLNSEYNGVSISSLKDIEEILKDVEIHQAPILIQAGTSAVPLVGMFAAFYKKNHRQLSDLKGCIGADPLAMLVKNGKLPYSINSYLDEMAAVLKWTKENDCSFQTIFIEGHPYHNGGANAIQEIAFMLATGVYYIRELQTRGFTIDEIAPSIQFSISIGSNLFMELAKLRAVRMLWAKIIEAFGGSDEAQKLKIHARTSSWTKTSYDPHVNILRGTVEAFTAAIGGVDSLHVSPFDETTTLPNEFSRRVSRNIQLVLQEEANITRTGDPAGGSWYVENITGELAEKAWTLFQKVEEQGGMLLALQEGFVQKLVKEVSNQKLKDIEKRKLVFVGATMYPNKDEILTKSGQTSLEAMLQERTISFQTKSPNNIKVDRNQIVETVIHAFESDATIQEVSSALGYGEEIKVEEIKAYRATESFEQLRQFSEHKKQLGTPLKVFLTSIGSLSEHKPRSDFSASFFEAGGFDVLKNNDFTSIEEATYATINSDANIACICGKNESYLEYAVQIATEVKQKRPGMKLFLAGKQDFELETRLKQAGIDGFIYIGANCFEILKTLQQEEGGQECE